jgi:beta-lactamase class A
MKFMRQKIETILSQAKGRVGFYYKNLESGDSIEFRGQEEFKAASIIKLPTLAVVWQMIEAGKVSLRDEVVVTDEDKVPGDGCFSLMPGKITTTVEALLNTMIAISDNTSTNKLLKLYSFDVFRKGFDSLGLRRTRVNRLLYDEESSRAGIQNYFTPCEIGGLLGALYSKAILTPASCEWILNLLSRQQIIHKIPCRLPYDVRIANKTGDDEGISHDVAIVYAHRPFVIGFASNQADVYQFDNMIRDISYMLYQENGKR